MYYIPRVRNRTANYFVGPAYHMLGDNYEEDLFIRQYHTAGIRTQVRSDLASFAAAGATRIGTRLWQVEPEETNQGISWMCFPYSAQEITNLKQYAHDVYNTRTWNGGRMQLWLIMLWLWAADWTNMGEDGLVGAHDYTWSEFLTRARASIDSLATVPHVARIDIDGEVAIGSRTNDMRFLRDLWPYFHTTMRAAGIEPGCYFVSIHDGAGVMAPWIDPLYPILNDHGSMFWVYRSIKFLRDEKFALPSVDEISFYPREAFYPIEALVERMFADYQAVFPGRQLGIAETPYSTTSALGRAYVKAFERRRWPVRIQTWPTTVDPDVYAGPPYVFTPFLPNGRRT